MESRKRDVEGKDFDLWLVRTKPAAANLIFSECDPTRWTAIFLVQRYKTRKLFLIQETPASARTDIVRFGFEYLDDCRNTSQVVDKNSECPEVQRRSHETAAFIPLLDNYVGRLRIFLAVGAATPLDAILRCGGDSCVVTRVVR